MASKATRVWVPTYFCQDVVRSWLSDGLSVATYPDSPLDDAPVSVPAGSGDIVLTVAYFGIRPPPPIAVGDGVTLVEDYTHDPFGDAAVGSRAHFALASLRKSLPVPDGAVLWSPGGLPLPPAPEADEARTAACLDRLCAMILKSRYLAGERVQKEMFRSCAVRGERRLGEGGASSASAFTHALLSAFPIHEWSERRRANWRVVAEALREVIPVLRPVDEACTPFSVLLRFRSREERDRVRKELIQRRVYPAVLWDLDDPATPTVPEHHRLLGGQLLSIHCDGRYAASDVQRIASEVRTAIEVAR